MAKKVFTDESLSTLVSEIKAYTDEAVSNKKSPRTVRFIVGTSASGWTTSDCDYLCDGTADEVKINAAIQALPSTGGEVVLLDGTYNLAGSIKLTKSNITLCGNGANTKLIRQFSGSSTQQGVIWLNTGSTKYCSIKNLLIDGNVESLGTVSYGYGIHLSVSSISNIVIEDNIIINCNFGVRTLGSKHTITGNLVDNCEDYAIQINGDNCIVIGNICTNNDYGIYLNGAGSYDVFGNTVMGNICNNNSDTGIYLTGGTSSRYNAKSNTISNNICNNNHSNGINADYIEHNTITGNTCKDNYSDGICIRGNNNTISGNTCYSNVYGMRTASTSNGNTITGNTFRDNTSANLRLAGSNYNVISGNNIAILSTDTVASNAGSLELYSTTNNYNIITDNHLGIKNYSSGGGTGNSFVNNYYDGASTTSSNAYTIDENGDAWFSGGVYVGGASQDDAMALASVKPLTTAEYEALEETNVNTLYMLTDGEEESGGGNSESALPSVTAADEGKFLRVVNGTPTWVSIPRAEEASF